MSYKLLLKKLYMDDNRIITDSLLKGYCDKLKMDYYEVIRYLVRNKYVHRILKGVFYFPSIGERKLKSVNFNHREAIAKALKIKEVNWYFGLETALKLNNLTHEFFVTDYVISDSIFRAKPIKIFGHNVRFIKLKKSLFSFGIIKKELNFSDPEKTLLDIVYLSKYEGLNDWEIKMRVADLIEPCSKEKLLKYATKYKKPVESFVRDLL